MRLPVLASLVLGFAARSSLCQTVIHEFRGEIVVTTPRIDGFGASLLVEQHLETDDLAPNERILGFGLVSPTFHRVSAALETRQVTMRNGLVEHRYIPTIYANAPLLAGFELHDRARVEVRDIARVWSRRYQNRSQLGHDVDVGSRAVWPYIELSLSYDTRYSELNRRDGTVGVRIPIARGTSIDPFLTRQSDTRRAPMLLVAGGAILRIAL